MKIYIDLILKYTILTIAERIFYLFRKLINKLRDFVCFPKIEIPPIITHFNSIFQFLYRSRILPINDNRTYINTYLIYILVDFHIRNEEYDIIKKKIRISIFPRIKFINRIAFFATAITRFENES
jgi:hypothetical protein